MGRGGGGGGGGGGGAYLVFVEQTDDLASQRVGISRECLQDCNDAHIRHMQTSHQGKKPLHCSHAHNVLRSHALVALRYSSLLMNWFRSANMRAITFACRLPAPAPAPPAPALLPDGMLHSFEEHTDVLPNTATKASWTREGAETHTRKGTTATTLPQQACCRSHGGSSFLKLLVLISHEKLFLRS